jgi:hypothetical protein
MRCYGWRCQRCLAFLRARTDLQKCDCVRDPVSIDPFTREPDRVARVVMVRRRIYAENELNWVIPKVRTALADDPELQRLRKQLEAANNRSQQASMARIAATANLTKISSQQSGRRFGTAFGLTLNEIRLASGAEKRVVEAIARRRFVVARQTRRGLKPILDSKVGDF